MTGMQLLASPFESVFDVTDPLSLLTDLDS